MSFLFQSLDVTPRLSARKIHICRLYDVLQLSLLRNDLPTAKRAWAILARCKEMNWKSLWPLAVRILGDETFDSSDSARKVEFLREMLAERIEGKEILLKELVLRQILAENYKDALDELELYLPSFPYQDDPVLHVYAGLLCLFMSQPQEEGEPYDNFLLHTARMHLQGARTRDPDNGVAELFIRQIAKISGDAIESESDDDDDRSDEMDVVESPRSQKRARTRQESN